MERSYTGAIVSPSGELEGGGGSSRYLSRAFGLAQLVGRSNWWLAFFVLLWYLEEESGHPGSHSV